MRLPNVQQWPHESHCNSHITRQKYLLKVKVSMSSTGIVWEEKVFETHITLLRSAAHSEKAADNTVSEDDFQFPSAKYEIIVLPISPAKLERQRTLQLNLLFVVQGVKSVTFLYGLITEINLEVDSGMWTAGAERSVGKTGIKVKRLSNHFLCMSLAKWSSQCFAF